MSRRIRLRRADGRVFLERWGVECRWGGVFVHRMSAPDPGLDLHDHPWAFITVPFIGGYEEERASVRDAPELAKIVALYPDSPARRGVAGSVRPRRPRVMRLDECHRVTRLSRRHVWTLVIHGPKRRRWGFYVPEGWVDQTIYGMTVRAERRDMHDDLSGAPT